MKNLEEVRNPLPEATKPVKSSLTQVHIYRVHEQSTLRDKERERQRGAGLQ
jgi:hypothetical protein